MGVKRIVETEFWTDSLVVDNFTVEDRLFFLYLLTNPQSRQLGIYKFNSKIAGFQTGFDKDVILKLLDRFENNYKIIKYSKETNEVAIINYLKYAVVSGGKPVEDLLKKDIASVKNRELLNFIFTNILNNDSSINLTVKKVIIEFFENNENESHPYNNYLNKHNGNGNESTQDVSYSDSLNDCEEPIKTKKNKVEPKRKYGEYKHVLLKDIEKDRLINEYGEDFFKQCIKELDEGIELKGYKYNNHNLAIRKWVVNAVKQKGFIPKGVKKDEECSRYDTNQVGEKVDGFGNRIFG